jgi:hypothetical protein
MTCAVSRRLLATDAGQGDRRRKLTNLCASMGDNPSLRTTSDASDLLVSFGSLCQSQTRAASSGEGNEPSFWYVFFAFLPLEVVFDCCLCSCEHTFGMLDSSMAVLDTHKGPDISYLFIFA